MFYLEVFICVRSMFFFIFRVIHPISSHLRAHALARSVTVARSSAVQASSSRWQERRWAIVCGPPQSRSMLRIRYSVLFVLQCIHVTCGGTIRHIAFIYKLKVAFNNAFRMLHNLPTYCSASDMFTVNRVADCKAAVFRNLVHRFMTRLTISKHLLVRSILSSDLVVVWSSRIRRHWARLLYVHYHGG